MGAKPGQVGPHRAGRDIDVVQRTSRAPEKCSLSLDERLTQRFQLPREPFSGKARLQITSSRYNICSSQCASFFRSSNRLSRHFQRPVLLQYTHKSPWRRTSPSCSWTKAGHGAGKPTSKSIEENVDTSASSSLSRDDLDLRSFVTSSSSISPSSSTLRSLDDNAMELLDSQPAVAR